jgi:hypothetical protein
MGSRFPYPRTTRQHRLLFWLATAGLLCLFPLFFVGGPGWSDGPLIQAAWNLGHPIFFGLLTLTVRPWRFLSGWRLWVTASSAVLILGAGVELAQSLDSRDMDGQDIFRNLTGLWAVLALRTWAGFEQPVRLRDWGIRAVALGLLAIDPISVSSIAVQQVQIHRGLPDLYDFGHNHPGRFWRGNVMNSTGENCGSIAENPLSIALTTRRFSGASLDNLPADWRGYEQLAFVLWNPQGYSIPLTLRINDLAHEQGRNVYTDRFNRTFQIRPGVNRIQQDLNAVATAPTDRKMDMDDVRRLMLFTSNLGQPAMLCLGRLRLTGTDDGPVSSDEDG